MLGGVVGERDAREPDGADGPRVDGPEHRPAPGPDGGGPPRLPPARAATAAYEQGARLTLFGAVAVSSAAISPVMGKMTRPAMRILLAAADARLGVWLPNPAHVPAGGRPPGGSRRANRPRSSAS